MSLEQTTCFAAGDPWDPYGSKNQAEPMRRWRGGEESTVPLSAWEPVT